MKDFAVGEVNRVDEEHWVGGGKALNLLRMMQVMGHNATAITAVGGATGQIIKELLRQEALNKHCVFYDTAENSRICDVLVERDTHSFTVINSQGPALTNTDIANVFATTREQIALGPDYLVLAGSLPPSIPDDFYAQLALLGAQHKTKVVVDATGDTLLHAIRAKPWLVKVNLHEISAVAENLADWLNLSPPAHVGAWHEPIASLGNALVNRGINLVITNGDQGSVAWTEDGQWVVHALPIHPQNTTGSGDAFLAGLLSNYLDTHNFSEALKWATAAAANNAEHVLPMVDKPPTIAQLAISVAAEPLLAPVKRQ